jgi:hydrophobic/amphiphilic exporter-1 (mainly G- bacteria), HAE1 family
MSSQFFISRPKFAFVISIVLVIAGLVSIKELPIAQYPQIVPPEVSITATYPGADAETIEKTVVAPIEEEVNGVEDMIYMKSTCSNDGNATIIVTFKVGSDPGMNTVNTENRVGIAEAKLPVEVIKQGIVVEQKSSDMLMILNVVSPNNKHDGIFLSNFASLNIRDIISRIPGVADVEVLGGQDYAMRIWLNPEKLTDLKITVQDVIDALNEQNVQVAAGQIGGAPVTKEQRFQYTVRTKGRLETPEEFKKIIIRAEKSGAIVRLKDIARIDLGAYSYSSFGQLDGKPSANLAVYQLPGANSVQVANGIKVELKKMEKYFPKDVKALILYDTTDFIYASINELIHTLITAIILVVLTTFLFLQDWRATFIPSITIPISLIATFTGLLFMGYTINTISLFGLILSVGIVIDDSILIIENVQRIMRDEGLPPVEATQKTMKEVTSPIIASSCVLLAVFVPVAFIPGITGRLYREFAVTISFASLISSANSLVLSPALCVTILRPLKKNKKLFFGFRWFNSCFDYITLKYDKTISYMLRRLTFVVIFFILILAGMYFIYGSMPTGFLPNEDQGAFIVDVQLPDGASLNRTQKVIDEVDKVIADTKGVKNVITVFGYSLLSGTSSSNVGFAIAILENWSKRESKNLSAASLIHNINEKLNKMPDAKVFAYDLPPIRGLGTGGGFEFVLQDRTGTNPKKIAEVMHSLIRNAEDQPEIDSLFSPYRANVPQIYVDVDRDKAKMLDIPLNTVFNTLQTFLGSLYVNDFNKFGKVYQVMLQSDEQHRDTVSDISSIYVKNKEGSMVPMSTIAKVEKIFGPEVIYRYNMLNAAIINGTPAKGYSSGLAIKRMEKIANDILPLGMTYSWTGTAYQEIEAQGKTAMIFTLALIFIYLFLVAQYESWTISFAVMLSVPLSIFGAIFLLWATGFDNNTYTQIGFVLLFGLSCKTAILMVEFSKESREAGESILNAARYGGHLRFRAVVMTSVTFIFGDLPLFFATGAGAASRKSVGFAIFGGMLMITILGTLMVPAFYAVIQKSVEKFIPNKNNKIK